MTTVQKDKLEWINHWRRTGPVLLEKQREELRDLSFANRQKQIANLLDLAVRFYQPRRDNGLVVFRQRLNELFGK